MSTFHNLDNTLPHLTSTEIKPVTTVVTRIDDHNPEATVPMVTMVDLAMVDTVAAVAVAVITEDLDKVVASNSPLMQHCCHHFNAAKNVI